MFELNVSWWFLLTHTLTDLFLSGSVVFLFINVHGKPALYAVQPKMQHIPSRLNVNQTFCEIRLVGQASYIEDVLQRIDLIDELLLQF